MTNRKQGLWIGGKEWPGTGLTAVRSPYDGRTVGEAAHASAKDLERAVAAAQRAAPIWADTPPAQRAAVLRRIAEIARAHHRELSQVESDMVGKPIRQAHAVDVAFDLDCMDYFAALAQDPTDGTAAGALDGGHMSLLVRDPIGVVAAVTPWNYPFQILVWKALAALALGNAVIVKPDCQTPLSAGWLARWATVAGAPDGLLNVVPGDARVGAQLVAHTGIDLVSFTGSTATAVRILHASPDVRRHTFELGGKAPMVVFGDASLADAVEGAAAGAFINAGQDCTAVTRIYVERNVYDEFVSRLASQAANLTLGDPADETTDMGPLVSGQQKQRAVALRDAALAHGARIVYEGRVPDAPAYAAFVPPTLLENVGMTDALTQTEAFAPIVTVAPFDTAEQALTLANGVPYGLAASVWTKDLSRALHMARKLAFGEVWVNDHLPVIPQMPHGGMKQSGQAREMSRLVVHEFTTPRHVMVDLHSDRSWRTAILPGRENP